MTDGLDAAVSSAAIALAHKDGSVVTYRHRLQAQAVVDSLVDGGYMGAGDIK